MRAACASDVQKFCAGVERGNGGLRECLSSHRAELSSDCVAARASLRNLRAAVKAKDKSYSKSALSHRACVSAFA
jgi:hypothetical protein